MIAPFVVAVRDAVSSDERRRRIWRGAAEAAGLRGLHAIRSGLSGSTGSFVVLLLAYRTAREHGTSVVVTGQDLAELEIVADIRGARSPVEREIPTGDADFDRIARVRGPAALARSVLDFEARRALRGLFEGRLDWPGRSAFWASGWFARGMLRVDIPDVTPGADRRRFGDEAEGQLRESGDHAVAGERLPEALQRVLALARRLSRPADVPGRIAEHLKSEPDGGVRLQLLATLLREAPDLEVTREALAAAREDPDAGVRLRAGIALGPQGSDVLLHLADGEGADDATTMKAVEALGERLSAERAASILRGALRTRRTATARTCLGVLGARGGPEAAAMLARVLAVEHSELASAAATALGDLPGGRAEAPLAAALDHHDPRVRLAAARALGRAGSVDSIARLKQAETDDPPLRAAARQAIASIQSRLPGAAPGQLSLAGSEAGSLSLADDEGGQLSLAGRSAREVGDDE